MSPLHVFCRPHMGREGRCPTGHVLEKPTPWPCAGRAGIQGTQETRSPVRERGLGAGAGVGTAPPSLPHQEPNPRAPRGGELVSCCTHQRLTSGLVTSLLISLPQNSRPRGFAGDCLSQNIALLRRGQLSPGHQRGQATGNDCHGFRGMRLKGCRPHL